MKKIITLLFFKRGIYFVMIFWSFGTSSYIYPQSNSQLNYHDPLLFSSSIDFLTPKIDVSQLILRINRDPSLKKSLSLGLLQSNPAVAALVSHSNIYGSLSGMLRREENNSDDEFQSNGSLNQLGGIYKLSTQRGSIVFGLNYSELNTLVGKINSSSYNTSSTVTDIFVPSNSLYHDAAFEAYAIDCVDLTISCDDADGKEVTSIFRVGGNNYEGIYQQAIIEEKGFHRSVSVFGAVEFVKKLYFGASFDVVFGERVFERRFIETDQDDNYDGDLIIYDEEESGSDVYQLTFYERLRSNHYGFSFTLGGVFIPVDEITLFASFKNQTKINIDTNPFYSIRNELDDEVFIFQERSVREESYSVTIPYALSGGIKIDVDYFFVTSWLKYTQPNQSYLRQDNQRIDEKLIKESFKKSILNFAINTGFNLGKYDIYAGYTRNPSTYSHRDFKTEQQFLLGMGFTYNDIRFSPFISLSTKQVNQLFYETANPELFKSDRLEVRLGLGVSYNLLNGH